MCGIKILTEAIYVLSIATKTDCHTFLIGGQEEVAAGNILT